MSIPRASITLLLLHISEKLTKYENDDDVSFEYQTKNIERKDLLYFTL